MARNENPDKLLRLSDTQLTVADPAEDVRGRNVIDKDGERIGEESRRGIYYASPALES